MCLYAYNKQTVLSRRASQRSLSLTRFSVEQLQPAGASAYLFRVEFFKVGKIAQLKDIYSESRTVHVSLACH